YLATGTNFSALHFDFLMGVSTISNIIRETCDVLWKVLQPREMSVPSTEDWLQISKSFYEKTQFPNCVGAVDGKHVRLECPKNSGSQYFNYKHFYSLILLAICDADYCFRIIDVGSYGKESDCNVFKKSVFGKNLYADKVNFPPDNVLPGDEKGIPQPYVIVGDEAFALNKHLLSPFPGKSLNDQRRTFNYRLSRARQNIESSPDFAVKITKAACVLHNFVRRRDGFSVEDTFNCKMEGYTIKKGVGNALFEAKEVREYFVDYINSPGNILSWQNKVIG
ncbi:protein ALP1-like, partial [Myzus persicae]|uniref:protein ALP1-like n=1 Tax=Myzus persicae TaxID=13164 RepID=UPI000B933F5C